MAMTKKRIGALLILIGLATILTGTYYLGRHDGLELMRKGDSGLGGFAEWGGSWVLIVGGMCIAVIGLLMRSDLFQDHKAIK